MTHKPIDTQDERAQQLAELAALEKQSAEIVAELGKYSDFDPEKLQAMRASPSCHHSCSDSRQLGNHGVCLDALNSVHLTTAMCGQGMGRLWRGTRRIGGQVHKLPSLPSRDAKLICCQIIDLSAHIIADNIDALRKWCKKKFEGMDAQLESLFEEVWLGQSRFSKDLPSLC